MGFSRSVRQEILDDYLGDGAYVGLHCGQDAPDDTGSTITGFEEPPSTELRYARFPLAGNFVIESYPASGAKKGGVRLKNTKNLYIGPLAASYTFTHFGIFAAESGSAPPIYADLLTNGSGVATPVQTTAGGVFTMEKEITAESQEAALRVSYPDSL